MKAAVFLKSHNGQSHVVESKRITLEAPSVVQLPIGPEEVARFERDGNDLILVLGDGTVLVIENFFVVTENGRNDLVFEDQNDVTWWAQYGDNWTGFDIAEINRESTVPLWPVLAGLGVLAGGVGIAIGGGGGDSNAAPDVRPEVETTPEDTPISGNLLKNDTDADGDKLLITEFTVNGKTYTPADGKIEIPGVGTIIINESGDYTFTPVPDWNGKVPTITYTVSDGENTTTGTLDIEVTPVKDIVEDAAETQAGKPVTTNVFENDKFDNPDAKVTGATNGKHGTVTINPDGTITYTPEKGYVGEDKYTYTVTSGGVTETTTVKVTVTNTPPVAKDDTATTLEDEVLTGNVLTGGGEGEVADTDPDGDPIKVISFEVEGATYQAGDIANIDGVGTITIDKDGNYTFTPEENYNGSVPTITYTISDGNDGGEDTADLNITVTPVNDNPVIAESNQSGIVVEAGNEDNGTVVDGTPSVTGGFTASDVDGDTLSWSVIGTPDTTYGTFTINSATGAWEYKLNNNLPATQALKEGESKTLTYEVQVSDGNGGTDTRTVTITINGTNDSPVANADTNTVTESGVLNGGNSETKGKAEAIGNVLTNDTDVDAGEKATLEVSAVDFGGLEGTIGSALSGTYGSLVLNANGTYTYTLDNTLPATQALKQGQGVTEVFTYTVVDVNGATSTSTLTITVTGTNDRPEITSTAADAVGEVTEQGTANPDEENIVTGTLTASDVDADATLTWSITGTGNGTYGTITIDANGNWTYTLDNSRDATQKLNDGDVEKETFTARVKDEHGAWSEQVITITVNGSNDLLESLRDEHLVKLTEDGDATGTLQDHVKDVDDTIVVTTFTVNTGNGPETFTFGEGGNYNGEAIIIYDGGNNPLGELTIKANGDYSFTPAENYAGNVPDVKYTLAEAGDQSNTIDQTLKFEITKVSDAPGLEANKTLKTNEDTSISLGLKAPEIKDDGTGTGNNDYPERIGEITLTIGGAGKDGVTFTTGSKTLAPVNGKITIVLTDEPHITGVPAENNANGVYYLTKAEYEALQANPLAESGKNFTVTVDATSYEVDADGNKLADVDGAASKQTITVDVQAVTDGATLNLADGAQTTFAEDGLVDLSGYLSATKKNTDDNTTTDDDGSEQYWYTVSGLQPDTVVNINGKNYTANAQGEVTSDKSNVFTASPSVTIKPPKDFSGDMNGIKVTLNSQDTDADSNGTIDTVTSEVTLDLHVTPVAGDVNIGGVETKEDTAVAFLKNVKVTDTGSGSEVITSASFTVPKDWTHNFATSDAGWRLTESGGTYTITFDNSLTEAAREKVLASFEITPPAHSSKDAEFHVSVTTTDTNMVNGVEVTSDPVTVEKDVTITVTPVAERTDTDSDDVGGVDVTMNADHEYTVNGLEDEWFALGTNYTGTANTTGGFEQLKSAWSNADPDEFTYAVLTPELASDSADDSVIGTVFRYQTGDGNWHEQTFVGEPIWVPVQYLDSLQVKLPPNVSGTLEIGMQAATVDYDDDQEVTEMPLDPPHESGPGVSVDISGGATLTLIEFKPVADDVTMALNGRATGLEDTEIPLSIKTTSSDPSETFKVTIEGIPDGAVIFYKGEALTVTDGKVTITDFDNSAKLSVTPPENSNDDFKLKVTAVSVDGDSVSRETSRDIDVVVTGVADDATVNVVADYVTTEAEVDDAGHTVKLDKVVKSVVSDDAIDGSETVTLRITGLDEDFSIEGAVLLSRGDPNGDGRDRVWSIPADKLDQVHIKVPDNYSGTVKFEVAGVTTEDDGDSKTSSVKEVSFTITPSPEATITTNATLIEDEITKLDLSIVHQNGDDNEVLGDVYIAVGYSTDSYTLYLGEEELSKAGLAIEKIGGVDYYVIPAGSVADLGAKAPEHKDGALSDLEFKYEVIDPSNDGTVPSVTVTKDGILQINVTPVTDKVEVSIDAITIDPDNGSTSNKVEGDNVEPDTVTVTKTGSLTVNFHVTSADTDGSEHLVRVLIEGVPDGVSVIGASQIGANSWMLVYEGADAKAIGENGLDVPVEFVVGQGVSHDGVSDITMTAMVRDQGQDAGSPALIEKDSVTWHLELELDVGTVYPDPSIDEWRYNEASGTEDTSFTLKDVMDAKVSTPDATHKYSYTVTITDLPAGTIVEGMIFTEINGVPTWTATVIVPEDGDSQAALDALLNTIKITPPLNSNDNNADFIFDAKLTAAAVGGRSVEEDATADMPVTPVTDEATIVVDAPAVDEGQNSVTVTISAESIIDGTHGTIVDGKLYVQMDVDGAGNAGGTLTDSAGNTLTLEAVTGIEGVPDGNYYVVNVSETGGSVDLTYQAPEDKVLKPGSVKFDAWAQTQENGAANTETSHTSGTAEIKIINNGVTVESTPVSGNEPAIHNKSAAIELDISVTLNDNDGSEAIKSILLAGVPVGFLVYVGDSAGNAHLAVNGGGDGNNNTWTLSSDGKLPDYIAILPPPHWSGTVDGLSLIVSSGEAGLPALVENLDLASVTVTPTADGLTLDPTLSFGREGDIIALNLNAAMKDPAAAQSTLTDGSTETTTLQISGLGEYASFYIGKDLYPNVTYDQANGGTYTITGLSQDDLDKLGFKQAESALTDQDTANSGLQLKVDAWTVESDGSIESDKTGPTSITVDVKPVLTSSRDDDLIWSGEAINGRAGTDTVHLRYGEDLTGAQLAAKLKNIEVLDLGIDGANKITDLTAEQVKSIIGSGNTLTIKGTDVDSVSLSGNWTDNRDGTYTSGSVTVKVTGNEDDVPSVSGAVEARSFSMMSFGMFDEQDSFGLASLDTHQPAQQTEPDAAPILIDDVLSSDTNSDDLTSILPEEHRDLSTPSSAKSSTQPDFVDMSSPDMLSSLEDEIMRSTHYEV